MADQASGSDNHHLKTTDADDEAAGEYLTGMETALHAAGYQLPSQATLHHNEWTLLFEPFTRRDDQDTEDVVRGMCQILKKAGYRPTRANSTANENAVRIMLDAPELNPDVTSLYLMKSFALTAAKV